MPAKNSMHNVGAIKQKLYPRQHSKSYVFIIYINIQYPWWILPSSANPPKADAVHWGDLCIFHINPNVLPTPNQSLATRLGLIGISLVYAKLHDQSMLMLKTCKQLVKGGGCASWAVMCICPDHSNCGSTMIIVHVPENAVLRGKRAICCRDSTVQDKINMALGDAFSNTHLWFLRINS